MVKFVPFPAESKTENVKLDTRSSSKSAANKKFAEKQISQQGENLQKTKGSKKNYYIVFVGNLPFSVTKEDIVEHFQHNGIYRIP